MADLTGQPYLPPDRASARAKTVITQIECGLNEATLDDVPDLLKDLATLTEIRRLFNVCDQATPRLLAVSEDDDVVPVRHP